MSCYSRFFPWLHLISLCASLFAAGCHQIRIKPAELGDALPVLGGEARNFLEIIEKQQGEVRSFRGRFEGTASRSVGEEQFKQIVVFEYPQWMRVELYATSAAQLVSLFLSDGDLAHYYNKQSASVFSGEASRSNLERVLDLPLLPKEAMLWLTGRIPVIGDAIKSAALFRTSTGELWLVARSDAGELRCQIGDREFGGMLRGRMLKFELWDTNTVKQRLSSEYLWAIAGAATEGMLPARIVSFFPNARARISLMRERGELNPDLSTKSEQLRGFVPPAGTAEYQFEQYPRSEDR